MRCHDFTLALPYAGCCRVLSCCIEAVSRGIGGASRVTHIVSFPPLCRGETASPPDVLFCVGMIFILERQGVLAVRSDMMPCSSWYDVHAMCVLRCDLAMTTIIRISLEPFFVAYLVRITFFIAVFLCIRCQVRSVLVCFWRGRGKQIASWGSPQRHAVQRGSHGVPRPLHVS